MFKRYLPFVWLGLVFLLIFSRFANINWGLPYPMHPDERNMIDAVMKLRCDNPAEFFAGLRNNLPIFLRINLLGESPYNIGTTYVKVHCANPGFFAYGQIILYMGYLLAIPIEHISRFFALKMGAGVTTLFTLSFSSIALSLRIISAVSSVATVLLSMRIFRLFRVKNKNSAFFDISLFLLATFSPVLIQFAHYGTTESILAFFYTAIVYVSLLAQKSIRERDFWRYIILASFVTGIAIAAKVSSLVFCIVPLYVICARYGSQILAKLLTISKLFTNLGDSEQDAKELITAASANISQSIKIFIFFSITSISLVVMSLIFSFFFSPHNVISNQEFLGSFSYERDIGTGRYVAFYTRQFLFELPLIFHAQNIFPYALGVMTTILFVIGFLFAPWKKQINTIRFSVIFFCFLTMPWYAKWTRFIAPVYPLMIIISVFGLIATLRFLKKLRVNKAFNQIIIFLILFAAILQGIGQLSIYLSKDVRYVASKWIFENIPAGSKVLSETANVIDVPIQDPSERMSLIPPGYSIDYVSFDFYSIDENSQTFRDYQAHLGTADYIFVPSRRVFYNHTCVSEKDGKKMVGRHSDYKCKMLDEKYPRLKKHYEDLFSGKLGFTKVAEFSSFPRISLFGKTLFEFPDEDAEETFTVFDHPVIRIYKRTKSL